MIKKLILVIIVITLSFILFKSSSNSSIDNYKNEQEIFEELTSYYPDEEYEYVVCEYDDKLNMMLYYNHNPIAEDIYPLQFQRIFYDKETFELNDFDTQQSTDKLTYESEYKIIHTMVIQNLKIDLNDKRVKLYDLNKFNDCVNKIDKARFEPYIKE